MLIAVKYVFNCCSDTQPTKLTESCLNNLRKLTACYVKKRNKKRCLSCSLLNYHFQERIQVQVNMKAFCKFYRIVPLCKSDVAFIDWVFDVDICWSMKFVVLYDGMSFPSYLYCHLDKLTI